MALDSPIATAALVADIEKHLATEPDALRLARLLYSAATQDGLAAFSPVDLASHAREALDFIDLRANGHHKIRSRRASDGVSTIVEIVNDDMPFLVDSVMGEVQARGASVRLVSHPIFKAARDTAGRLTSIAGPGDQNWADGHQESLIVVHLDALQPGVADELVESIDAILYEVRLAVTDWKPMIRRVDEAIAALAAETAPIDPAIRSESIAFLRWLVDGHFTFLGARSYRLHQDGTRTELKPVDLSGHGILRNPAAAVLRKKHGRDLTPEGLSEFQALDPLVIAKADIASRVHRRVLMDYVGIKTFDRNGKPDGELRLIGLLDIPSLYPATLTNPVPAPQGRQRSCPIRFPTREPRRQGARHGSRHIPTR